MAKITIFTIILLLGCVTSMKGQNWNVRQPQGKEKQSRSPIVDANSIPSTTSATSKGQTTSSRGIGAWGYIGILLFFVLSGIGAYYFVILYPVVCKKERMYDVMEMTSV